MNNEENNLPIIEERESIKPVRAGLDPKEVERSRQVVLDYINMKTPASLAASQGGQEHPSASFRAGENIRDPLASSPQFNSGQAGQALKQRSNLEKIKEEKRKVFKPDLKRFKTFFTLTRPAKKIKLEKEKKPKPTGKILKVDQKKREAAIFLRNIEQEIETTLEEKLETAASPAMKASAEKVRAEEGVKSARPLRIGFRETSSKINFSIIVKPMIFIICFLAVFVLVFYILALPLFGR